MLKEFKKFIMTGNVIDLAIAVILAGAIGAVIKGFVSFIMMPIIGMFIGGASFAEKFVELSPKVPAVLNDAGEVIEKAIPANNLMYGAWIDSIISLIIVGFVLFLIVRAYNKTKKKEEAAPAEATKPTVDQDLLVEIRDLLKK
ncbi:MAG: large conductance mechanosensitive channel [Crocinitomicaceae bacterium]|jgi:large conductance mechanosensitive channel